MNDNHPDNFYQVVIIGGGPAGIATGLTLNALGVSNCIIEASDQPKSKFGEALPPNSKPLLNQLDILNLVEDDHHLEYYGNKTSWGSDSLERKEFITEVHGCGFLLDRLYFEKQLWIKYKSNEGSLFTNSRLKEIIQLEKESQLTVNINNKIQLINCLIVVDATGRKSSVCRHFGITKINLDHQFSLSCTLKMTNSRAHEIIIEATPDGWWYAAPNGQEYMTFMFFTHKDLIPSRKDARDYLIRNLDKSKYISKIIEASDLYTLEVKSMVAGTSRLNIPYGDRWIAVGDAAFSYDPISSYGITSALASGYYAGQAISSKFQGKEEAMDAYRYILENAFQAYSEKLNIHYNSEKRWTENYYWKERAR